LYDRERVNGPFETLEKFRMVETLTKRNMAGYGARDTGTRFVNHMRYFLFCPHCSRKPQKEFKLGSYKIKFEV
jgi:hypothetical protein